MAHIGCITAILLCIPTVTVLNLVASAAAKLLQSCPTLPSHRRQPTRLLSLVFSRQGNNIGLGCHFLLQGTKVKSESEVAQSYATLKNPMNCSLPGSSINGIFQARVLECVAIAFSTKPGYVILTSTIFRVSITNSTTARLSVSHACHKITIITTLILIILLSIGSLPPVLGFRPK